MAEDHEVVVFGAWASPYSRRIEAALKLKGVPYKYIEEDLGKKSPSLLKYNPIHKKIPVLVHNGKPIAESLVILEYIDETWQEGYPSLMPKDPYQRSLARFWAKFIDDKCMPAIRKACWGEEQEREKAGEEVAELLKLLEKELKEKRFFGGENIRMVDIAANIIGFSLGAYEEASGVKLMTREKFPKLCNWRDEFMSNSAAIKENAPPREELISFLRNYFRKNNS
ncbi:glutathione S-transferase U8-like [Juglans microcarpa x Juglans regia]|uniref:glutathione S-transferase U8-like n=1 Tax=Juglans microcarpa x Juglans regia TaxID=2249226 RepID=UPI001B7EDC3F|nr:glutathione S-transferase U8-like [Juglans microcarpa x Juglans regia]